MNTFKSFFKKHLALNLLALILPIFIYFLNFFLVPKGYIDFSDFHPVMVLFIPTAIIGLISLVCCINAFFVTSSKSKKIASIIFFYFSFAIYLVGYYLVEYFIFAKKGGFIADITQENSSLQHLITDALYTILAPSFVTVFVAVGVILFTVYLIRQYIQYKRNKQTEEANIKQ